MVNVPAMTAIILPGHPGLEMPFEMGKQIVHAATDKIYRLERFRGVLLFQRLSYARTQQLCEFVSGVGGDARLVA